MSLHRPGTAKGLSFVEERVPFEEAIALAEYRGIDMAPDLPEWVFQRIRLVDSPALTAEQLFSKPTVHATSVRPNRSFARTL